MNDFAIWNVALDASQINDYMNCNLDGTETGLIAYWNFNQYGEEINYLNYNSSPIKDREDTR